MTRARLLLVAFCLACGSPPPAAYTRENDAALAARKRGEHRAAAEHYERAARVAKNERDGEEARYRAAESYLTGGEAERAEAIFAELAKGGSDSERSARANFALADLWQARGATERAEQHRVATIRTHPDSGLARKALERHLRYLREQGGPNAALAYLRGEATALNGTELSETLSYRTARELDEAGKTAEARDQYLACAARFPYPGGAYWDDALFRAAQKELELSAAEAAVRHLRRLLAEQESANFTGSYERARYAEAQLELGRIYRDVLRDATRARQELRKVWQNHPKSTLADDALFQEALLARTMGDEAGTCSALDLLASKLPESRYAPCAHLLCERVAPTTRPCNDYIKRAAELP